MRKGLSAWFILLCSACVEPYEIENTGSINLLVVEGVLSDQMKAHQIFVSRATAVGDQKVIRERGASVTITDDAGGEMTLEEKSPGVYETPVLAAEPGRTYTLKIATSDGSEYSSAAVPFKSGAGLGAVYMKYVNDADGKRMEVYADTEDPSGQTRYYRWNYIETAEVHAPFPSNWVWLGGNNVTFRIEGIDTCYATDTLKHILIRNTRNLAEDKITGHLIRSIPGYSHILRHRYSILVQQYTLSEAAYSYWDNLRLMSESQGGLSDIQPGTVPGNMFSITHPDEPVLGFFEAASVSEKRIFFKPIDFYDEGFQRPPEFRSYCYDISPLLVHQSELGANMTIYQNTMFIWEAYGLEPNAMFQLMPKTCCDCRDQGPTEPPPFF